MRLPLVRHHYSINYVNYAIGLENIGNRNVGHIALLVLEHEVFALVQHNPSMRKSFVSSSILRTRIRRREEEAFPLPQEFLLLLLLCLTKRPAFE